MKKSFLSMSMLHFSLAVFLCFSLSFCGGDDDKPPPDTDGDGIEDAKDNCVDVANPEQVNTDDDAMGDVCDMDDDDDDVPDMQDAFPNDACASADADEDGMPNTLVASCTTNLIEDTDDDNDDIPDTQDAFPNDACASVDTDEDGNPDTLVTGCTTSLTEDTDDDNDTEPDMTDVDDDNDGLIEIATASELNNMRWNLAGTTYDDEIEDSTPGDAGSNAGGPALATDYCKVATDNVYLCGYELVADIDLSGEDLNDSTAGNFNSIGNLSGEHFTAYLEGNGYTISGLNIDITGEIVRNSDANDAAFIASCRGVVSNLILADAVINGHRRVAALCATMHGGAVRNVQITGNSDVQISHSSSRFRSVGGGLVGYMEGSSRISNSIAIGDVSVTATGNLYAGGLVGYMEGSSRINNSTATGDVAAANSNNTNLYAGGLVGYMEGSSRINNSTATGDFSASATGSLYAGGLVGYMSSSHISNSATTGGFAVIGNIQLSASYAGGLVGYMSSSSVSNSIATRDVTGFAVNVYGGLVGFMEGSSNVSNSYATGDVAGLGGNNTVPNTYAGGLVGYMQNSSSVSNSTATGDVSHSSDHPSGFIDIGGLVGYMSDSSSISNSIATGDLFASFPQEANVGGLVANLANGSISNSYFNSEAMQVRNDTPRAGNALRGVGSETTDPSGVNSQTLSQIQSLDASTLTWNDNNHWSGVGIDGQYPLLRYANNPHTSGVDECEFLPGFSNTDDDKVRCGDLLPLQELYRASDNLVFSNTTIGTPTSSAPGFFYSVDSTSVTATYNLATDVTLTASGVEQKGGTVTSIVNWDADSSSDGTTGQITSIDANETFWLALTFQQDGVTHKVRWKFVRPAS